MVNAAAIGAVHASGWSESKKFRALGVALAVGGACLVVGGSYAGDSTQQLIGGIVSGVGFLMAMCAHFSSDASSDKRRENLIK